jgi:predicted nucleotidyltransferase
MALLKSCSAVQQVILYGSRAKGTQRSGSDIDLCLVAPEMELKTLLLLGAQLDDLLLPYSFDLSLHHLIDHPALLDHIQRVGITLWQRQPPAPPVPPG